MPKRCAKPHQVSRVEEMVIKRLRENGHQAPHRRRLKRNESMAHIAVGYRETARPEAADIWEPLSEKHRRRHVGGQGGECPRQTDDDPCGVRSGRGSAT